MSWTTDIYPGIREQRLADRLSGSQIRPRALLPLNLPQQPARLPLGMDLYLGELVGLAQVPRGCRIFVLTQASASFL